MPKKKRRKITTVAQVMEKINAEFPGALKLASDEYFEIYRIPTGILAFDRLTGGGIAVGRYTEIFGQESTLKSFVAGCAVCQFMEAFPDKRVMWIDAEGSFDGKWMARFGIDLERLDVITSPDSGEATTEILEIAMKSRGYCLFVVDSIAALMPQRETEYEATEGEKAMGSAGKMTSAMMRRLTRLNQNDSAFILINQVRDSLGVTFGDPSKPTGGRAIPYYDGQRIEFRRGENIRADVKRTGTRGKQQNRTEIVSRVINMNMKKDKTAPREGVTAMVLWHMKEGVIDEEESLLIIGMEDGLVQRAAASITIFPDSKKHRIKVRGWDAAKDLLRTKKKLRKRLRRRIDAKSEELGHSNLEED